MIERRAGKFTEILSIFMVKVSAAGAFIVLIDLKLTLTFGNQIIQVGGTGFSDQLKGAVIALILVSGYSAVKEYWLGASDSGKTQSESMSRIAEASTPSAAVTAPAPLQTEEVNIAANSATVTTPAAAAPAKPLAPGAAKP